MYNPSFQLLFITKGDETSKDCRLSITPRFGGDFTWSFKDATLKHCQEMTLSRKEAVEARLETLLDLLDLDDEPFVNVQLDVPGFPVVLFDTPNLYRAKDAILRAFRQTAANWPHNDVPIKAPPVRRHSVTSTASSTTCDSMPGLETMSGTEVQGNGFNRHWLYTDI